MLQAIFKTPDGDITHRNYTTGTTITIGKTKFFVRTLNHIVDKNTTIAIIDVYKNKEMIKSYYPISVEELDRNIQIMESD
jgi:hypothetical protein